jgi:hypothetical protein
MSVSLARNVVTIAVMVVEIVASWAAALSTYLHVTSASWLNSYD